MIFDPLHFLPLLEQKMGALDQAAPLQGWDLPDVFATLHRLVLSRLRSGPSTHLCGLSLKSQGAFAT